MLYESMETAKKMRYILNMSPVLNKDAMFSDGTEYYRTPVEPREGDTVTVRFRTQRNNVDNVCLVHDGEYLEMKWEKTSGSFDYYTAQIVMGKNPVRYYFEIHSGLVTCYYDTNGVSTRHEERTEFEIYPGYHVPEWLKGAVMYQIYVDRFCNGDPSNDVETGEYFYIGDTSVKVDNWEKVPAVMGVREFYGGDLQGVMDKLDYIQELGVDVIYLNPVFVRDAVYKLFEEEHPDIVVNFAAESHVDRSIENPEVFLDTNIKGTAVLMDACRKYGIQRYHQVSTDEVYGDLPLDRPDLFFTEETPIHTSSPYSSSKAGADLLVLAYHRTYGLPVTISRCSNNYGPYHFPEKLIPLMIANALNDKPLPVYGKGENVRDWLYVEDHCRAIDLIIHKGRVGEVYNVGGHNEMKNIDIVKLICKELGKPESLITHVADRKGHDMRYAIDPTKIHNELGWLPETKFADGIKKTIKWYLDNKEWWETIISGEYQNYYEKMYGNREEVKA